jgi:Tol biopolymer transport system component
VKISLLKGLVLSAALLNILSCDLNNDADSEPINIEGLYDFYLYDVALNKTTILNVNPQTIEHSYSISPNSQKILYVNYQGINLMNIDGTGNVLLVPGGESPCFSPNGDKIVYIKSSKLYTINADGTNNAPLTIANSSFWKPLWSYNGLYVACNSSAGLSLVSMNGDIKVISSNNSATWCDWSIDSNELFYCKYDAKNYVQLFKYNIANNAETKLTDLTEYSYSPDGSPIDNEIAFISSVRSGGSDLCLIKPDGSGKKTIIHKSSIGSPFWSPTGTQLTFVTEDSNLAIIDKTGENYKLINEVPGACLDPIWSNDGKYILYYRAIFYN